MTSHHPTTPAITIVDHELPYDTHNTYDVIFYGNSVFTTVTCDPTIASQWISEVEAVHRRRINLNQLIVGLDVEWRPSFNRFVSPAWTLQLCVGRRCLIFQLIHSSSVPPALVIFLANPNYTFVGIGIGQDLEKLEEDYEFGFNTKTVDLRELAAEKYGRRDLKSSGVESLAALVLEKEVEKPKSVRMSRWDNEWLTPTQVRYACVDAYVCFEIGRVLNASHPTKPVITIVDHELPYDTHNTYDVIFYGVSVFTTVTCDPTIASQWISEVEAFHRRRIKLNQLIVGLDVEWRPSFNRFVSNPAATLQLCVGRRCLIFQLIHSPSVPPALVNFLANPNYTFVGIGIGQDLEKLEEDYEFGFNTNTVDLRELAAEKYGRRDLKKSGVKSLAELVLEKEVEKSKSVTMSGWDNEWLTPTQVRYACVDAYVCFEIGRVLNASAPASAPSASR